VLKRINDIFYSLQGEGHNTGRAAVFIRFAGCNLRCGFCDTAFDSYREMSDAAIVEAIAAFPSHFVVLTGGEPTLQVDEAFVELLHAYGYEVAMESNGTRPAPVNIDWLTVSPKSVDTAIWTSGRRQPDELKVVFDELTEPETYLSDGAATAAADGLLLYLQPCDTGDKVRNATIVNRCVDYIESHPWWRLSLQTHKLIGIE